MARKQRSVERRDRRRRSTGRRIRINDAVSQASVEEVLEALEGLPGDLDWGRLAADVVPLLPRRRPMPLAANAPLAVLLPPGIMTGFGVDVGPAVLHIHQELVAGWGLTVAELVARGLANLRLRTESQRPRDVQEGDIEGVSVRSLQTGDGVASALLLLPDELIRIFGSEDQWFVAPMRDLLLAMPSGTDPEFVGWLNEEVAALDPNALALEAFSLRDGRLRLEPLGQRAALA